MKTVVASFDAKSLWKKTEDNRVKRMKREDEMALIRRFVSFALLCILEESSIDPEFVSTDVFLGIEHQFYLRIDKEVTYVDAETERENRTSIALKCIAWTSNYFQKRTQQLQITRRDLKPRKNESREEHTERYTRHTQFVGLHLWCAYKSEHNFVEETMIFSCHLCKTRFEQEINRGLKLPLTINSKTHWVRFCSAICRNRYIEESATAQYHLVIAQLFEGFDPKFVQKVLSLA